MAQSKPQLEIWKPLILKNPLVCHFLFSSSRDKLALRLRCTLLKYISTVLYTRFDASKDKGIKKGQLKCQGNSFTFRTSAYSNPITNQPFWIPFKYGTIKMWNFHFSIILFKDFDHLITLPFCHLNAFPLYQKYIFCLISQKCLVLNKVCVLSYFFTRKLCFLNVKHSKALNFAVNV